MLRVFRALVETTKHEVLYDQVLLPWTVEWLMITASSNHRGMRHTSTEIAMALLVHLVNLRIEVEAARASKERLVSGKRTKKDSMAQSLVAEIETLTGHAEELSSQAHKLFEMVFLGRYRDTSDDIRLCCVEAIGACIETLPSAYLSDTYLKYLGWQLNDASPLVRHATLRSSRPCTRRPRARATSRPSTTSPRASRSEWCPWCATPTRRSPPRRCG